MTGINKILKLMFFLMVLQGLVGSAFFSANATDFLNDKGPIRSPISGRVIQMNVQPGQQVMAGDCVCIIEAMKMEHRINARLQGEIKDVFFKVGDMVAHRADLVSYAPLNPNQEDIDQGKSLESKAALIFLFSGGTGTLEAPSHTSPPKGRWKTVSHPEFLENKDFMVFLYPWMAGILSASQNIPPPYQDARSNILTTLSGSELNQQALSQPEFPLANPVIDRCDQSHKTSKSNTTITHKEAEKKPSIRQGAPPYFQQKGIQRGKFKDTSGVSALAWTPWVCGLVILNKIAFALKSLGYSLLRRVRLKKYAFIVAAFPRTAYLHASDCNKHLLVKRQTAHNMNRRYFGGRKCA